MKVVVVFGTRPEAIKMAPVITELRSRKNIKCVICVTAQHREMLDSVLDAFKIVPDYDLNIMKQSQTLAEITVNSLLGIEKIIEQEKPDLVLVHGDTTTSFAGALAAFYNKVSIGHVESGLRTNEKYSPYPEEMNRQFVDCVADFYFAPTETAKQNLINENKLANRIFVTGNTAIDTLRYSVKDGWNNPYSKWLDKSRLILLTAHRRENLGEPMRGVFCAVMRIIEEFQDVKVIYPIHKNPAVRSVAYDVFGKENDMVKLVEPLGVVDFHNLMSQAYLILTDSGGIQEEAPSLGKPVLVSRDTTERPEGVEAGTLKLVGTDENDIYSGIKLLLTNAEEYSRMSNAKNPYGDGYSSKRIVDIIESTSIRGN